MPPRGGDGINGTPGACFAVWDAKGDVGVRGERPAGLLCPLLLDSPPREDWSEVADPKTIKPRLLRFSEYPRPVWSDRWGLGRSRPPAEVQLGSVPESREVVEVRRALREGEGTRVAMRGLRGCVTAAESEPPTLRRWRGWDALASGSAEPTRRLRMGCRL